MAEREHFSLRWNNFHSNLSEGFHSLLEEVDLVDVTLAAEAQYLQAHKIVLSVCSPYFRQLFKANPCKHPIVIMKDVLYKDLEALLLFIYRGEVNVCQEELASFLKTAEMLQIKGLAGNNLKTSESSVASIQSPPLSLQDSAGETVRNCELSVSDSSPPCKRQCTDTSLERNSSHSFPFHLSSSSPPPSTMPILPCTSRRVLDLQSSPQETMMECVLPNTKQEPLEDIAEVEDTTPVHLMQLLEKGEMRQPGSEPSPPDVHCGPSQVLDAAPGLSQDNESSQDGIYGAPACERKVMQTMHHVLYLSASRGRCNGRVRKRCVHCYETNRRMLGCRMANQKTLKVSTFCGTCPKYPFMCVNCFKIHVIL